jgi:hypothetical protein
MFAIILDIWNHVASLKPAFISKSPHFNFITVHYFWIIGMAILGSICLYPRGGLKYIDALFLASGAATQSGLNTVDINKLDTWQQIVFLHHTDDDEPHHNQQLCRVSSLVLVRKALSTCRPRGLEEPAEHIENPLESEDGRTRF